MLQPACRQVTERQREKESKHWQYKVKLSFCNITKTLKDIENVVVLEINLEL